MIVTTTPTIEGYEIVEYLGIIAGEAVSGINMFKDLGAGIRNVFGGRSAGYEEETQNARSSSVPTPSWAPRLATKPLKG